MKQATTKIPVLGHSEGVCHVYIDKAADPVKAVDIAVDAKVRFDTVARLKLGLNLSRLRHSFINKQAEEVGSTDSSLSRISRCRHG